MRHANQCLGAVVILACSAAGFGCGATNSPKSGTLKCGAGPNPCPAGYECYSVNNFCYRHGEVPSGTDGGSGDGISTRVDGQFDGLGPSTGADGASPSGTDGALPSASDGASPSGPDVPLPSSPDARDARIPVDTSPPDAFVPISYVPSPSGHALVPGGITSSSENYTVVRTAGQSPGGNRVCESALYRFIGGVVGSTQKK